MSIDRLSLLEWLLPYCEPNTVCIMYPKGKSDGPGWVNGQELSDRAIGAYRAGSLASESFDSITQDGKPYRITHGSRLALVPHRDGGVVRVCFDFDDHEGVTADRMAGVEQLRGLGCKDYGNAQRLVRRHGANIRYC